MNDLQTDVMTFYDAMAADYHLIFADWEQSVIRQGEIIDRLIQSTLPTRLEPVTVLDCACGIGTQAVGLAKIGRYQVYATDISVQEIERAKREAQKMKVQITFDMADMRSLSASVDGQFDVVMAFDNAIPHLLTDEELYIAAGEIRAKTHEDGMFMASIRDYDVLIQERLQATSHRVVETPEGKRITFQVWDWEDDLYTVTQFIITPISLSERGDWQMRHYTTQYRALQRDTLTAALQSVGFGQVRWLMPEDSGYYQPIVVATS